MRGVATHGVLEGSDRLGGIQSVQRAMRLLELIADRGEASLTELSIVMALPRPTVFRFLKTLVALRYLRQLPSRKYALGFGLVRLAGHVDKQIGPLAEAHLETLVRETGETANLALLEGQMIVYMAHALSPHPMRVFTEPGTRAYAHATAAGKAILATLDDEGLSQIMSAGLPAPTKRTITDPGKLTKELKQIREVGFATDSGEQYDGVCCYAVAIPDSPIPLAISVSGPQFRLTGELASVAISALVGEARAVARDIFDVLD